MQIVSSACRKQKAPHGGGATVVAPSGIDPLHGGGATVVAPSGIDPLT